MATIRVEEKSLQLALVKAAGRLSLTQNDIEHKVVQQSHGFLGLGRKVVIEAWPRRGRGRAASASAGSSPSARAPLPPETVEALKEELATFTRGLCLRMLGREVSLTTEQVGDRLVVDIADDELAAQMTKSAKLAEAFEHILRKKPRHLRRELPFRIFVDVNGVRRGRESDLVTMAQDLSDKVHANREPVVLGYRSSYDRKVIHMALDRDERVYTKSIGSGSNRKLMILPRGSESDAPEATESRI